MLTHTLDLFSSWLISNQNRDRATLRVLTLLRTSETLLENSPACNREWQEPVVSHHTRHFPRLGSPSKVPKLASNIEFRQGTPYLGELEYETARVGMWLSLDMRTVYTHPSLLIHPEAPVNRHVSLIIVA